MNENILKSELIKKIISTTIIVTLFLITVPSVSAVETVLDSDYDGRINEAIGNVSKGADSSNSITFNQGTYNKTTDINIIKNYTKLLYK